MEVPRALGVEELIAIQRAAAGVEVLRAAREAYQGAIVMLKGPEVASRYPAAALRPSTDLDILVGDADQAQRALLAAGFVAVGPFDDAYYEGLHHTRPLCLPAHPSPIVEIHRRPNWVDWVEPPRTAELLSLAVPGATGVPDVLALPPAHHSLVVAAHSWGERPFHRILDLVDVAALLSESGRTDVAKIASRWQLHRMWNTTLAATQALFFEEPTPLSLRTWARDLQAVRGRTVVEDHIRRWVSPFWARPAHRAIVAALIAVSRDVTPAPSETWGNKFNRVREAALHPGRSTAEQERVLGPEGVRPRFKRH